MLQAAGFVNLDLEVVVQHSDALGLGAFRPQLDLQRLDGLVRAGFISEQQSANLEKAAQRFLASPEAYMMMLFLMVCGERPQ
jgi:hypothetical protein